MENSNGYWKIEIGRIHPDLSSNESRYIQPNVI